MPLEPVRGRANELLEVVGGNRLEFSVDSMAAGVVQTVRHYQKIDDMVTDLKVARIYGGMHYRNSVNDGATLGVRVANYIGRHHFRRVED